MMELIQKTVLVTIPVVEMDPVVAVYPEIIHDKGEAIDLLKFSAG